MKKLLSTAVLFGLLPIAWAGSTNIYTENWGTGNSGVTGDGNLSTVGWTPVAITQTAGPYIGIFTATGATDPETGEALPANTLYCSDLLPTQTTPGMVYTTDSSGSGAGGNSEFTAINPTLYTNLTLSVEERNGGGAPGTNYFAVQVGGSWYVATSYVMPDSGSLGYPQFTNAFLVYTNAANAWNALTINSTDVTIGAVATPSLTSPITGVGIVVTPTTGQPNFNQFAVQVYAPNPPPPTPPSITASAITPQYTYVGGGASFLMLAAGTAPLTYIWETNGVPLSESSKYSGTTNNMLTITDANEDDGQVIYSVIVSNAAGSATNDNLTLNVQTVPDGLLYAESFPYVGPNGNLPITGVGWLVAAPASTVVGIYEPGPGLGDVFSYSPTATTNAYYATDGSDLGLSGLPFQDINPADYPAVSFQAGFVPGNAAGQVSGAMTVYWAVAMDGTWYCSAQPVDIDLSALGTYNIYQYGFNPSATNWNNLTIASTGATIGGQAASDLTGSITGAGLVVAHNDASGSDMNFQNFEITTNAAVATPPSIGSNIPLPVSVASGGGASFGVSATGTQPFTYGWTINGVPATNGGRISGANTATLTITNLTSSDDGMQIIAFVTNSAGYDESDSIYGPTTLTVTNAPVGVLYTEAFPFVGPTAGNYPISSVGWVEAVPGTPNALFQTTTLTSDGAVFAYLGTPGTTAYYATTASDNGQSGVPFPKINLASYADLSVSVDMAPAYDSSNVTAFVAVQLNGVDWYIAATPLPVPKLVDTATFSTYTAAINPAAAGWRNLTVTSSGAIIGATASGNLHGVITGAGLAFVTVGSGGTMNFQNYVITGSGLGGVNVGSTSGGLLNLSWVGNPAVNLQSSTSLSSPNWQDVPNTLGTYSASISLTGPQKFFRLVRH